MLTRQTARPLNAAATKVFRTLIDGLEPGGARYVGKHGETFMRVAIDRLSRHEYAVAHRFECNGDLVPDPDVEFYVTDAGEVYPTAIEQGPVGVYRRAVHWDGAGDCRIDRREQADIADFCNMWMRNIKEQQQL
jgi:hypothetical protein